MGRARIEKKPGELSLHEQEGDRRSSQHLLGRLLMPEEIGNAHARAQVEKQNTEHECDDANQEHVACESAQESIAVERAKSIKS